MGGECNSEAPKREGGGLALTLVERWLSIEGSTRCGGKMQKETVMQVVEAMPDDIDLDALLNKLYVLEKIEQGERSLRDEGGVPHEEVLKRYGL
jgi:hypothetical protein